MTLGQDRVRLGFNPGGNTAVTDIKQRAADCIDWLEAFKQLDPRLCAIAQTCFEEAAMWAVKLVTTEKK